MIDNNCFLAQDIKLLGIEAEIHSFGPDCANARPNSFVVHFKTQEDLNLYKMTGYFQETPGYLEFRLQEEKENGN